MGAPRSSGRLPVELLVSVRPPDHWLAVEQRAEETGRPTAAVLAAAQQGRTWRRPELADSGIDWDALGVVPRFLGSETTACAAALQPSIFNGQGSDELERYLAAAARRDETAILVSQIGDPEAKVVVRNVFSSTDVSLVLPGDGGTIGGRQLPLGATASLSDGLQGADRDLALRLRNRRDPQHWWALELQPLILEGTEGREERVPGGVVGDQ